VIKKISGVTVFLLR